MLSFIKKIIALVCLGAITWTGFTFGAYYEREKRAIYFHQDVDFSLFWEAYNVLQEKFAEPDKMKTQEIIYGAISGMAGSLEDSYTTFFSREDAKIFMEDVKGVFEGVGMEIGIRDKRLTVIAPLENTPAQKAGFMPGDVIIKIENIFAEELSLEEAVKIIRGPKGTKVNLTVFRDGWKESKVFEVERDVIKIPSLKWELISSGANKQEKDIAYLKLYHFSSAAENDFKRAAFEILESPAQKIIFDLRNNPGGYLSVARNIAGWFLEDGDVVVFEDFGREGEKKKYSAEGTGKLFPYRVVVLINRGTASGSEILAAALRDNRGVKLIGETSFGKGSVQEMETLSDGSKIKITVANWLTPKGEMIMESGLTPDIEVKMTEEDYKNERDPQLEAAIKEIAGN